MIAIWSAIAALWLSYFLLNAFVGQGEPANVHRHRGKRLRFTAMKFQKTVQVGEGPPRAVLSNHAADSLRPAIQQSSGRRTNNVTSLIYHPIPTFHILGSNTKGSGWAGLMSRNSGCNGFSR